MMTVRLKMMAAVSCLAAALPAQVMAQAPSVGASAAPISKAQAAVARQIDRYVASINDGDIDTAKMLWADSGDISFINTTGIHKGWPAINGAVHTFFRDRFTKRALRLIVTPAIQVFGHTAIAEFTWDFDGVMTSGKELHTRGGRESQVYIQTGKGDWRLVHAHYSLQPPPIAP